jgi:hypothetical protein
MVIACGLAALLLWSCRSGPEPAGDLTPETVTLVFEVELNQRVYEDSTWGDPPQMAIWLEDAGDGSVRTVAVTRGTGAGDWEGKVECGVALPCWVGVYNRETGTDGPPTWNEPAADAVTCATPRTIWNVSSAVPRGSQWEYYVEVNVSGDYNVHFPNLSAEGRSDRYGNGQPSLVYRGSIEAVSGTMSRPELVGRTDQHAPVAEPTADLSGITTARELLKRIEVSCKKTTR